MISAAGWVPLKEIQKRPVLYEELMKLRGEHFEEEENEDEKMDEENNEKMQDDEDSEKEDQDEKNDEYQEMENLEKIIYPEDGKKEEKDDTTEKLAREIKEEEIKDLILDPEKDFVLLSGVTEDEESRLEVYIYEKLFKNVFLHHDYLMPSPPLSVAFIKFPIGGEALAPKRIATCMIAVGTFENYIEIWDLDLLDAPIPLCLLGGPMDPLRCGDETAPLVEGSHTGSVISLSWSPNQPSILASASSDKTVKLWDLTTGNCVRTLTHHKDKVCVVAWNPAEVGILATAGYDGQVTVMDIRQEGNTTVNLNCGYQIEALCWLPVPHHSYLVVSTEIGMVYCVNMLKDFSIKHALWKLEAHSKPTIALAVTSFDAPNGEKGVMLATGSTDNTSPLKLWDITDGKPSCIFSGATDLPGSTVFSLQFSTDDPFLLVLGCKGEDPVIMDTQSLPQIANKFKSIIASRNASIPHAQQEIEKEILEKFEKAKQETDRNQRAKKTPKNQGKNTQRKK